MVTGPASLAFPWVSLSTEGLTVACPAKVNVFLEITRKRPDGYHELQTLILTVDLFDTLTVTNDATGTVTCESNLPGLPTGPGNLVVKAALALQSRFAVGHGAKFDLTKRIPHEAGLGGGSSDAAMALVLLNTLWGLHRTTEELRTVAAEVGSDVGAFLSPGACWCTGRGEQVEPLPQGRGFHFVLLKPPVGCPTSAVYQRVAVPANPESGVEARLAVAEGDPDRLAGAVFNRLESAAFLVAPAIRTRYDLLRQAGPLRVWVTGSGSTCVALCRDRAHAQTVAETVQNKPVDALDRCFIVRGYPT